MLIALDYDGTYDVAPDFWKNFIGLAQAWGHEVILATYRDDRYDKTDLLKELELKIPVYYTRGVAKKWWMEQFAAPEHSQPNVWIDDKPKAILENSSLSREGLTEWRNYDETVSNRIAS